MHNIIKEHLVNLSVLGSKKRNHGNILFES